MDSKYTNSGHEDILDPVACSNAITAASHRRHGDVVLLGVRNHVRAAAQVPLPPGGDDLDVGLQGVVRDLKADLQAERVGGIQTSKNDYTFCGGTDYIFCGSTHGAALT